MENVVAFNNELSGLYDSKPPISKAKMAAITKAAMRAIKFYKHVVQSVEKFILKCKPEYKVPGLYVIDSIVRQSRHQYGPDKDVFAPRFARNIKETFANLFRCAPEDKSRIIRVLNLWQKNSVFAPEVIQPIFDLADPNHPIYQMPLPCSGGASTDILPGSSNGLMNNSINTSLHASGSGIAGNNMTEDKMGSGLPDLSNNNLKQLLNDPNVLRQLQTLQNFQKFKQQEDKQHKLNEMRMQDDAFEKHIQNVLKGSQGGQGQDTNDFNAEVEFVSMEQNIEDPRSTCAQRELVINLDGNDSRSPTPDRDRYKSSRRRSRTRSRSRDRRGNSRDRSSRYSRSPKIRRRTSRERDRSTRDKERDREHERERRKKGLPDLKKDHLSVCSTTLWVGHLSKLVYQEELSDTFGEFGDIVSIDQIVPRGCAFIVMNRRQDAYKAMQNLKNHKLQGRAITISWAAGKGVKSKEWKDYWDLELGVTYIPWNKLDDSTDFDSLEEGGMFDEDSMPSWMKEKIAHIKSLKDRNHDAANAMTVPGGGGMMFGIDTTQPPPGPPPGPPSMMPMVPGQFAMAPPMGGPPRPLLGPMSMPMPGLPMPPNLMPGMPPPHAMMVPPGMMPPGFPPMPAGGPPPPQMSAAHMGLPPPNAAQYPPPVGVLTNNTQTTAANSSSDDQMDIEMEEDDNNSLALSSNNSSLPPQMNFNQPPPLFSANSLSAAVAGGESASGVEMFSRDRNRSSSRWGGGAAATAGAGDDVGDMNAGDRWRENGSGNFNDNRNSAGRPLNIPPLDLNNPPLRPDFMNDFDNRAGARGNAGPGPGPRGGDFFNNMQQQMPPNRFNQPTSLLQMRIPPPPNMFSPRMGGSGGSGGGGGGAMFMRGGPPGMAGGRQQGPGFFNPRNPFSNDGGRGNARGGNAGGQRGGRGGRNNALHGGNWSDEDIDDGSFKRRGRSGSRFAEANDERNSNRGSRRGGGGQRGENRDFSGNRNNSRSAPGGSTEDINKNNRDSLSSPVSVHEEPRPIRKVDDTEEDWDRELEEYDARMAAQYKTNNNNKNKKHQQQTSNSLNYNENSNNNHYDNNNAEHNDNMQSNERANKEASHHQESPAQEFNNNNNHRDEQQSATYDELPQPAIPNTKNIDIQERAAAAATTTGEESNANLIESISIINKHNDNCENENTQATSKIVVADVFEKDTETTIDSIALETEN